MKNWKGRSNITIHQMDCLEAMKDMEDNAFDLAIVDPPYGIGIAEWDKNPPTKEYFKELFRVSKNQIIWGFNHFELPSTSSFIFWDKKQQGNQARGELAWASIGKVRYFLREWQWDRNNVSKRYHVCQKPVKLYEWLLINYAKEGDKILDTHLGSGSHALACWNLNFNLTAYELDPDYFEATAKRIEKHTRQIQIF